MSLRMQTLRGSDDASLPALSFDTANVQTLSVAVDTEATVSLSAGVYYLVSRDADFSFTHGTGDLSGNARIPWFRDVYLELVLTEDATVAITMAPGASGDVVLVPAREHS